MRALGEHYILNPDHSVRVEPDVLVWAAWYETADRTVAKAHRQGFEVSTVFLGLDHRWGDGPPLLFETMIFQAWLTPGGPRQPGELYCERYSTWDEALAGHRRALEAVANMEVAE
jgi:hypothetical protein